MRHADGQLDILFVVSPSNARSTYVPVYYLYLAGYLEKKGFRVGIVDPHERKSSANIKIIIREIHKLKPRYVGLAVFVTDYDVILNLAQKIKQEAGSKIIVGNAQPSVSPHDFLYVGSPFDLVVRGEGELTLEQILEEYDESKDNSHIRGIAYLHNGAVIINASREYMNLSECGMPAYHLIDMKWPAKPRQLLIRRLITSNAVIQTSRGCPYHCSFCAANAVWKAMTKAPTGPPLVRKRPLAHVMEELRILQDRYHFDFFYILDDTFGMTDNDIIQFCDAYRASGMRMLWAADTRVNCIQNESIVKTMKEAGCIQLDFGVETGSPRLLKLINKHISISQIEKAFSLCRNHGIRTFANMLINLPDETEDDLAMSHELLARIKPTSMSVAATQPYPGTAIYSQYMKSSIPKEHYCKLNCLYPSEDCRMARHNLDFERLIQQWSKQYGIYSAFDADVFKADRRYWKTVLKSKRKYAYLLAFLDVLFKKPMGYFRYHGFSLFRS